MQLVKDVFYGFLVYVLAALIWDMVERAADEAVSRAEWRKPVTVPGWRFR